MKQFKIPDMHMEEVEKHVIKWHKLGVIEPAQSSPIFAVAKKNGGIWLVKNFRALNAETHINKYCMRDISKYAGEIGQSRSTIFSTLDFTANDVRNQQPTLHCLYSARTRTVPMSNLAHRATQLSKDDGSHCQRIGRQIA